MTASRDERQPARLRTTSVRRACLGLLALCFLGLAPGWSCNGKATVESVDDGSRLLRGVAHGTSPDEFKLGGAVAAQARKDFELREKASALGEKIRDSSDWACPAVELLRAGKPDGEVTSTIEREYSDASPSALVELEALASAFESGQLGAVIEGACKVKDSGA
jgi:hypothetical protein